MAIKVNGKLVAGLGKSAYEQAQEGGYTGTEEEFISALANIGSNPTTEGLPVNDVRTGTVRDGQSIAAGDVVNVQDGEVYRDVVAQKNVENVIQGSSVNGTDACYLNGQYSVVTAKNSSNRDCAAYLINNLTGKSFNAITISNSADSIASVDRLDDTHFVAVFESDSVCWASVYQVTGTAITLADGARRLGDNSTNPVVVTLSTSNFAAAHNSNGRLRLTVGSYPFTSSTANELNSVNPAHISATRIPNDDSGNKRVCICFSDTGDGNKGKAVIATIDSANAVTFGEVKEFEAEPVGATSCAADDTGNVYTTYRIGSGLDHRARIKYISISNSNINPEVSYYENSIGNFQFDTATINVGGKIVAQWYYRATVVHWDGSMYQTGNVFLYNTYAILISSASAIDQNRLILSYADAGNSNYGTTTILEISGNQIAGSFLNNSKDAIALESGEGGDTIKFGFGGYCACEGITAGQTIDSEGVTAYSPLDGWLKIIPWQEQDEPEIAPYVVGEYTGGGSTSVEIDVGFVPKLIIVKCVSIGFTTEIQSGFLLAMLTQRNTPSSYYIGPTYLDNNRTVSVDASSGTIVKLTASSSEAACNHSGALYRYIAFR